jgi:hypothetical protein
MTTDPLRPVPFLTQYHYASRELALCRVYYPGWVETGVLSEGMAQYHLRVQQTICNTLAALVELTTVATAEECLKVIDQLVRQTEPVRWRDPPHRRPEKTTSTPWRTRP